MIIPLPELHITFGHRSNDRTNDRTITTRDCLLVVASRQVWPVINTPVEMSFFVSPIATQRRPSDIAKRTFEKWQKGLDVLKMEDHFYSSKFTMTNETLMKLNIFGDKVF